MLHSYFFPSESVSNGHLNKRADRISEALHDRCLVINPQPRLSCETLLANDLLVRQGSQVRPSTSSGYHPSVITRIDRGQYKGFWQSGWQAHRMSLWEWIIGSRG